MKNRIIYAVTIIISILYIFVGNKIATKDFDFFNKGEENVVLEQSKVTKIIDVMEVKQDVFDGETTSSVSIGKNVMFNATITAGDKKGQMVEAIQTFDSFTPVNYKQVEVGDKIFLYQYEDADGTLKWYADEYIRLDGIIILAIIFAILILLFGRSKGVNTLVSLVFTVLSVFIVFVPSILSGQNIYISSIVTCVYITAMTLLIVYGANKKSLAAGIGCVAGVLISGLLTVIMSEILQLTGILNEESIYITYINEHNPIDLKAIIFGSIILGAIGAIMDVAMSIASSLYELCENIEKPTLKQMLKSGLTIGRDIMGTMANTLVLAYIGSSLSVVLLLCVYNNSLMYLLNREMIIVEVLQALVGSLGILMAIPFTTFISSVLYIKHKEDKLENIEKTT